MRLNAHQVVKCVKVVQTMTDEESADENASIGIKAAR